MIVETSGSVENAELISNHQVDAALLQGGIKVASPDIETIGALFFEPMVFLTGPSATAPGNPALWKDLRISIGPAGSGTAAAYRDFEAVVGLPANANQKLGLTYDKAIAALMDGIIDIAVLLPQSTRLT